MQCSRCRIRSAKQGGMVLLDATDCVSANTAPVLLKPTAGLCWVCSVSVKRQIIV